MQFLETDFEPQTSEEYLSSYAHLQPDREPPPIYQPLIKRSDSEVDLYLFQILTLSSISSAASGFQLLILEERIHTSIQHDCKRDLFSFSFHLLDSG